MAPNVNEVDLIANALAELECMQNPKSFSMTFPPLCSLELTSSSAAATDVDDNVYWMWPHRNDDNSKNECYEHDVLSTARLEERLLQDASERSSSRQNNNNNNGMSCYTNPEHDDYWQWSQEGSNHASMDSHTD